MFFDAFEQFKKTLGQMEKWLQSAEAHAVTKSFDPTVLLSARLAPDQFPLLRQVQIACDTAKLASSRLTGKDAPKHADDEQTLEQLRARIQSVLSYLNEASAADYEGAATRQVTQPRWEGKHMVGAEYFWQHALPNFFFHSSHVYALLRHNGVGLGKRDFLGQLSLRD